jgi:hypothetical protein
MKGCCMNGSLRVITVGGMAAGPKVASKIVRLCPKAEVTLIKRGKLLSHARYETSLTTAE